MPEGQAGAVDIPFAVGGLFKGIVQRLIAIVLITFWENAKPHFIERGLCQRGQRLLYQFVRLMRQCINCCAKRHVGCAVRVGKAHALHPYGTVGVFGGGCNGFLARGLYWAADFPAAHTRRCGQIAHLADAVAIAKTSHGSCGTVFGKGGLNFFAVCVAALQRQGQFKQFPLFHLVSLLRFTQRTNKVSQLNMICNPPMFLGRNILNCTSSGVVILLQTLINCLNRNRSFSPCAAGKIGAVFAAIVTFSCSFYCIFQMDMANIGLHLLIKHHRVLTLRQHICGVKYQTKTWNSIQQGLTFCGRA